MISNFSLWSGKPKKTLSGVFSGGSISEFNGSWNLEILFDCKSRKRYIGISPSEWQKEQRGEKQF